MSLPKLALLDADAILGPLPRVYIIPRHRLRSAPRPATLAGEFVTFVAPHPALDDLLYATTGPPALLDFLPEPAIAIDEWDQSAAALDD